MKRELRFRIYNKKEDKMYLSPEGIHHLGSWFDAHFNWSKSDENDLIVMQSTGLKDKNGTMIFEGDTLSVCNGSINGIEWMDKPYPVSYELNSGFLIPMFCWDKEGNSLMDSTHWCEVIGNIHELNKQNDFTSNAQ